jgi:hypothetical protein
MIIDYESLDDGAKSTVRTVESKPHVRYIRYLLTKRHSPITIKKELQRLGLSAPHEPVLIKYYLAVIDPLVKKYKLNSLYSDYKNKILSKNKQHAYSKNLLNYKLNIANSLDMQINFCKFVKELEIDEIWGTEIMRSYGSAANVPIDENGDRIIKTTSYKRRLDIILLSPKRYLIDKMIVENVPDLRIADYCRKEFKMTIYNYDIAQYKEVFFNLKTHDIEENIRSLEVEKKSLQSFLEVIDSDKEMELGEKIVAKQQTEKRIMELDENIKTLNTFYTEFAFAQAQVDRNNFISMFQDVVGRAYSRFCNLDNYKDRDVVEPLFKVTRMMGYALEKVNDIVEQKGNGGDKHSQFELMKLYRQRADDLYKEQAEQMNKKIEATGGKNIIDDNIDVNSIEGTDELGYLKTESEDPNGKATP